MKYNVGDMFIDIRPVIQRNLVITDILVNGLEPIHYELYIMPDDKHDFWPEYWLKMCVEKKLFMYYPVKE